MKRFEVGKRYLVHPHSLNAETLRIDYKKPTTMVVVKRTESTIWCEVNNGYRVSKETHRILKVSKEHNEEAIDCGYKDHGDALYVWAGDEIK